MKRFHMKKTSIIRKAIHDRLAIPFKRALRMSASASASDMVAKKGVSDTHLTHDNLRKIKEQILKAEMLRSYGIQQIYEKQRCR